MLFLPGPAWLLLSKIARRLIHSLYEGGKTANKKKKFRIFGCIT